MFQADILFGIPIYKTKIDPSLYDKKNIISTIEKNYNIGPRNRHSNYTTDMHMSFDDEENNQFEKINYEKLKKVYNNVFNNFVKGLKLDHKGSLKCNYDIINYTASNKNNYMGEHNHLSGHDFACVHYLQIDKSHVGTTFRNTHTFGRYLEYMLPDIYNLSNRKEKINSYIYSQYTLGVEEDDLIIFPSVVNHFIKKLDTISDKLRITIATNLKLEI